MDQQAARESLNDISVTRRRVEELRNYRDTGSIVSAWGLVWLTGFGAQQFVPSTAPMVWLVGWVAALGWTFTRPRKAHDAKAFVTWLVTLAFILLLLVVIKADQRIAAMVTGLVLSAAYAVMGLWAGKRFLALAVIVLISACTGWWLLPQWLFLLLAVGGGFALLIGGFWLRRP